MISTDNGAHWSEATDANFPAGGIDVTFDLPKGITAANYDQFSILVSHMKDSGEVELLTPTLQNGKLVSMLRNCLRSPSAGPPRPSRPRSRLQNPLRPRLRLTIRRTIPQITPRTIRPTIPQITRRTTPRPTVHARARQDDGTHPADVGQLPADPRCRCGHRQPGCPVLPVPSQEEPLSCVYGCKPV